MNRVTIYNLLAFIYIRQRSLKSHNMTEKSGKRKYNDREVYKTQEEFI